MKHGHVSNSPYNVSLVSPTSSGWAPSSFTTPQQQQSIGSASWTHEFKGVPLRCGWYHSGRTAVPSVNIPIFFTREENIGSAQFRPSRDQRHKILSPWWPVSSSSFGGAESTTKSYFRFTTYIISLLRWDNSWVATSSVTFASSRVQAKKLPIHDPNIMSLAQDVNPSFTQKKTQLDHSSQNKNVKPFQVWLHCWKWKL